jgi:hypothetical protein
VRRREAEGHRVSKDPSPYLVRLDSAGGHLFDGQGLLQRGAKRGSVVPAATLPGPPATENKGGLAPALVQGVPRVTLWDSGRTRSCTCIATTEGATACTPAPPWPAVQVARGRGQRMAGRTGQQGPRPRQSGKAAEGLPSSTHSAPCASDQSLECLIPCCRSPPCAWGPLEGKKKKKSVEGLDYPKVNLRWHFCSKFGRLLKYHLITFKYPSGVLCKEEILNA